MTHVNSTTSGVALNEYQVAHIREIVENAKCRSAWDKGVKLYALDILNDYSIMLDGATAGGYAAPKFIESVLLMGAENWLAYSEGGCSLVYSADIAQRLCNPSELKRKTSRDGGMLAPHRNETWIQTQGRALNQAWRFLQKAASSWQ